MNLSVTSAPNKSLYLYTQVLFTHNKHYFYVLFVVGAMLHFIILYIVEQ